LKFRDVWGTTALNHAYNTKIQNEILKKLSEADLA